MIYFLIYLLLGILPAIKMANKEYDKFEKTHTPSSYEYRYKWVAKSLNSIVYGLAFIISLILWPLTTLELLKGVKHD